MHNPDLMTRAIDYFARWYATTIDLSVMAHSLGVSVEELEQQFLYYRSRSAQAALTHYRLNRLCDAINHDPEIDLAALARRCGFRSLEEADRAFSGSYCQNLMQFQDQCRHVLAWRRAH